MKLQDYLTANDLTYKQFANKIGVSFQLIGKYVQGSKPRESTMAKIVAATNGQVTANDFYDIDSSSDPGAAGDG